MTEISDFKASIELANKISAALETTCPVHPKYFPWLTPILYTSDTKIVGEFFSDNWTFFVRLLDDDDLGLKEFYCSVVCYC